MLCNSLKNEKNHIITLKMALAFTSVYSLGNHVIDLVMRKLNCRVCLHIEILISFLFVFKSTLAAKISEYNTKTV